MAYNERKMLEDVNGDLIPQYYDPVEDVFKPLTNDPRDVRLTGSNVEQDVILKGDIIREEKIGTNITVEPGMNVYVKGTNGFETNCNYISVGIYRVEGSDEPRINLWPVLDNSVVSTKGESSLSLPTSNRRSLSDRLPTEANKYALRIDNREDETIVYDVTLFKHYITRSEDL